MVRFGKINVAVEVICFTLQLLIYREFCHIELLFTGGFRLTFECYYKDIRQLAEAELNISILVSRLLEYFLPAPAPLSFTDFYPLQLLFYRLYKGNKHGGRIYFPTLSSVQMTAFIS